MRAGMGDNVYVCVCACMHVCVRVCMCVCVGSDMKDVEYSVVMCLCN